MVVIIAILAAIALPKYQEVVEKSRMQEAIVNLRIIANANDRFYLINNRYALATEMDKLDIEIPGEIKSASQTGLSGNRVITKYFIYAPNFSDSSGKAVAHRVKDGVTNYQNNAPYYLHIRKNGSMGCVAKQPSSIQEKLCNKISTNGHL